MTDRSAPKPAPKPKKRKVDEEDENKIDFTSPRHFSDVVLLVEDREFHVHKAILSMWSPVFERMFTSEFRERSALEIPLPGKRAKEIEALLNLMYSKQDGVTDKKIGFLFALADEYQMEKVKELCTEFVISHLTKKTSLHFYSIAKKYYVFTLMEECKKKIILCTSKFIQNNKHFSELSSDEKIEILFGRMAALERVMFENHIERKSMMMEEPRWDPTNILASCKNCQN